jgi:hypothetical protein
MMQPNPNDHKFILARTRIHRARHAQQQRQVLIQNGVAVSVTL